MSVQIPKLDHARIPDDAEAIRSQVRSFLTDALAGKSHADRAMSWMGYDAAFSEALGARGWIGMTLPSAYGGGGKSAFMRYVVSEELLAAGAPVAAHWIADRQSAHLILKFGSEDQRRKYLPAICRGALYFCIGMSEPGAGSDLAGITTSATKTDKGWVLRGAKVWTTNAHRSHAMIVLARTDPNASRHAGLSQFIVELDKPGISVSPIRDMTGEAHFNEVVFDDVELEDDCLIGDQGQGWTQVMAELAFERSGPERFLSSIELLKVLIARVGHTPGAHGAELIGRLTARLVALRQMSLSVTAQLGGGNDPSWAASCVKDLGTSFEQDIPELAQSIIDCEPSRFGDDFERVLAYTLAASPSFSLRGGTREILRGIIARGIGLR